MNNQSNIIDIALKIGNERKNLDLEYYLCRIQSTDFLWKYLLNRGR